jgi:LysM repeat protein
MNKEQFSNMSDVTKTESGRAPWLVATVVALHVVVVGAVLMNQGCGTLTPREEVPAQPSEANMPPSPAAERARLEAMTPPPVVNQREVAPAPVVVPEEVGPTYTIEKGDSLSSVAYRYGVSWREVAELNGIKDPSKIRIGQKIKLPAYAKSTPAPRKKSTAKAATKPGGGADASAPAAAGGEYVVKSGDSLSRIASRNGTTIKALRAANNLTGDKLRIGQKLVLPGGKTPAVEVPAPAPVPEVLPTPTIEPLPLTPTVDAAPVATDLGAPTAGDVPFEYTVKAGEKLADVARMFSVLEQELLTLNGLAADTVKAGDKIKIPMSP